VRTVNWGPVRKLILARGSFYARTILGVGVRDLTGGFKCFAAACSRRSTSTTSPPGLTGFQIELTLPHAAPRASASRGADRLRRSPGRPVKMSKKIFLERSPWSGSLRLGQAGRVARSLA